MFAPWIFALWLAARAGVLVARAAAAGLRCGVGVFVVVLPGPTLSGSGAMMLTAGIVLALGKS
jgi:hypothetical protein